MRFDWPVGAARYRALSVLPGGWYVALGFDQEYVLNGRLQVHPGIDLNRVTGGDTDLGEPVYAVADGLVAASGYYRVWGNIVLLRHSMPDGGCLWSQYAHLDRRDVRTGQSVRRGYQVGTIGKGDQARYSAHLHFEIRRRDLAASYWPGTGHQVVQSAYVDPMLMLGRVLGGVAPGRGEDPGAGEDPSAGPGTGGEPGSGETPGTGGEDPGSGAEVLEARLRAWAERAQVVRPNEGAALWRALRSDGFFPISDEGEVEGYAVQVARSLASAEERIYFARPGQWQNVLWIRR